MPLVGPRFALLSNAISREDIASLLDAEHACLRDRLDHAWTGLRQAHNRRPNTWKIGESTVTPSRTRTARTNKRPSLSLSDLSGDPRSRSTQWPRWSMVSGCRQVWTRMSRSYPVLSASTPLRPKHVVRSHDRKTLINTPILAAGSRHSRRMPAKKSCKLHPKLLMDSEVSKL